jgi:serine/threonine protein phosphatase PrpC
LQVGERLILFSDGLIEISNDYAVQSQQIKRLLGLLMDNAQQPLQVLADLLALEIEKQEINDDISVILLEKNI